MGYKASEQDLIAYLYGELEGIEKETMEQYLLEHADARAELDKLRQLRSTMSHVRDKEVIAPPIFRTISLTSKPLSA
jgi:anti-sigma factor RsiW